MLLLLRCRLWQSPPYLSTWETAPEEERRALGEGGCSFGRNGKSRDGKDECIKAKEGLGTLSLCPGETGLRVSVGQWGWENRKMVEGSRRDSTGLRGQ